MISFLKKFKKWIIAMFIGGTVLAAGIETNIIGLGSDTASSTIPIIDYTDRDNLIASSTIQEYINTISSIITICLFNNPHEI